MVNDVREFKRLLEEIRWLDAQLLGKNIFLTWRQSLKEVQQVLYTAEALKWLQDNQISAKAFESGLAIFQDRDNAFFRQCHGSGRDPWPVWTAWNRFAFVSAANLLGLSILQVAEEEGEIEPEDFSYLAGVEVIGIQDTNPDAVGEQDGTGEPGDEAKNNPPDPLPGIICLQNHRDHPGRAMAEMLQLKHYFGSLERLAGKKITVIWSCSSGSGSSTATYPLPAAPPAVAQGFLALVTRFGMEVTLAYPEGYDLDPAVLAAAHQHASASGGTLTFLPAMGQALSGAEAVFPVNWNPYPGDVKKPVSADWTYGPEQRKLTREGNAFTLGQKIALEFHAHTVAALVVNNRFKEPARLLESLRKRNNKRLIYPV
jgi:ornithine carbamoyltransferase